MTAAEKETYSIPELVRKLGVSRGLLYEEAKSGKIMGIPVILIGARVLVPRAPVDRALSGERPSTIRDVDSGTG